MRFFSSSVVFGLFSLFNFPAQAAISQVERDTLQEFYSATAGNAWHNNSGWKQNDINVCSWYGVGCDVTQTTVISLSLAANNLKGAIPSSFVNLTNLGETDFQYNGVYSTNSSILDFISASHTTENFLATQTLDASGISFSSLTKNSFQINWESVGFVSEDGGYRVYVAEQIDTETGSEMTNYQLLDNELSGKNTLSVTLLDLQPCRQYFIKIISYTNAHANNAQPMVSDGMFGEIKGTVAGASDSCNIIGSEYDDIFIADKATLNYVPVMIDVADSGERSYLISSLILPSLDGAGGTDTLKAINNSNFWVLSGASAGAVNNQIFTNFEILIGDSESDEFAFDQGASFTDISNTNGSGLVIGDPSVDWSGIFNAESCDSGNRVAITSNSPTLLYYCEPTTITIGDVDVGTLEPVVPELVFVNNSGEISAPLNDLSELDGVQVLASDGTQCVVKGNKCFASDNTVYVLLEGRLVKESDGEGSGSINSLSLYFLFVYMGFGFARRMSC